MTSIEFCRTAGLTERELRNWLDYGLLDADVIGRDGGGQVETNLGWPVKIRHRAKAPSAAPGYAALELLPD
jgi:hypothetical protein